MSDIWYVGNVKGLWSCGEVSVDVDLRCHSGNSSFVHLCMYL